AQHLVPAGPRLLRIPRRSRRRSPGRRLPNAPGLRRRLHPSGLQRLHGNGALRGGVNGSVKRWTSSAAIELREASRDVGFESWEQLMCIDTVGAAEALFA